MQSLLGRKKSVFKQKGIAIDLSGAALNEEK